MSEEIPDGFKKTEIGVIPEEWEVVKLGNIASIRGGYGFSHKYQGNSNGKYPFYKVSDMNLNGNEVFMKIANNYVSEDILMKLKARPFPKDTIIFPKVGAAVHTNKKRILLMNSLVDNNVMGVTVSSGQCIPIFLLHYFYTVNLSELSNPGPLPSINAQRVKSLLVPLPPLPEQQKIAHVLSTIQGAKEKTEAVIKAAKALKKSLMKYLFTYGPVPLNEAENVKLKETEIGLIPEEWEVKKLIDIATLQRGKDLPKRKQIFGSYPIVGSSGIIGYHNEYFCHSPGVVVGRSGSIGNLTYVEKNYWAHNTGLYVKDFHGNDPKFVYYLLHLINFKKYATGVSVPTLNRNFIHPALLPCPSIPIQQKIASILSAVDEKIEKEENKRKSLEELFKSMLHNLMTGKVRVKDLEVKNERV